MLSARTSQGHRNNLCLNLKGTIWPRSMSAFLKSTFLNSNDASTIRRQNGSNNSLSVTLQLTLVSAVPKKPPKDFSRSGFFSTIRLKGAT